MKTKNEGEVQILELIREIVSEATPKFTEPYVALTKDGLYISLTESDNDDAVLSWSRFEKRFLNAQKVDFDEELKLLEDCVKRLKEKRAAMGW
jgi:hypothetical protein